MNFRVLSAFAALSLVSLSACGGANTPTGLAGAPAANVIVPLTKTVVVTALNGGSPVRGLEISLTRNTWPGGKLIAKGKTGPMGRVRLSGNWTNQELICVGGRLHIPSGYKERHKCELPFPPTIMLRF
jgi:hypothetical protein